METLSKNFLQSLSNSLSLSLFSNLSSFADTNLYPPFEIIAATPRLSSKITLSSPKRLQKWGAIIGKTLFFGEMRAKNQAPFAQT